MISSIKNKLSGLFSRASNKENKGIGTIIVFIGLCIFFSVVSDSFLTVPNLLNILLQISTLTIISLGMTWVIISGGIDLSVGAQLGLCGVASAMLIKFYNFPVFSGLIISILLGGIVGITNGLIITKVHIPPLLTTIGMSTAVRGLAYILCGGSTIFGLPDSFNTIGRGYVGVIPIPVLIALFFILIFYFIEKNTKFSIHTYAIGGNTDAAYLSGIKTNFHIVSLYVILGLMTGLAAFINASRMGVGIAGAGSTVDFDAVTAVVLGGTSIKGGTGKIMRTVLGCIIIGVISNGMMILNVHSFAQQLAKGLILLLAIGIETIGHQKDK